MNYEFDPAKDESKLDKHGLSMADADGFEWETAVERKSDMPKLKVWHISPTREKDAAINAGIAADPDSRELDAEWFAKAKPASEVLPPEMYAALVAKRPRGRPKADETKVFTAAIRLDADLLEAFKATGKGWQTRVNAALRQYLNEHPIVH